MLRRVSSLAVSLVCCAALVACASAQSGGVYIGAKPYGASKKSKRAAAKSCRSLRRDLRRMEQRRETLTPAYDRAIAAYVDLECGVRRG